MKTCVLVFSLFLATLVAAGPPPPSPTPAQVMARAIECTSGYTTIAPCTNADPWKTGRRCIVGCNKALPSNPGNSDKVDICHGTSSEANPMNQISISMNAVEGHFFNADNTFCGHGPGGGNHYPDALAGFSSVGAVVYDCNCNQFSVSLASGCKAESACFGMELQSATLVPTAERLLNYQVVVAVHNWCNSVPDSLAFSFEGSTIFSATTTSNGSCSVASTSATCTGFPANWKAPATDATSVGRIFTFQVAPLTGLKKVVLTAVRSGRGLTSTTTFSTLALNQCPQTSIPPRGYQFTNGNSCGSPDPNARWYCKARTCPTELTPGWANGAVLDLTLAPASTSLRTCDYDPANPPTTGPWAGWSIDCTCTKTPKSCPNSCFGRGSCNFGTGTCYNCQSGSTEPYCYQAGVDSSSFTSTDGQTYIRSTVDCPAGQLASYTFSPGTVSTTSCDGTTCIVTSASKSCTKDDVTTTTSFDPRGCSVTSVSTGTTTTVCTANGITTTTTIDVDGRSTITKSSATDKTVSESDGTTTVISTYTSNGNNEWNLVETETRGPCDSVLQGQSYTGSCVTVDSVDGVSQTGTAGQVSWTAEGSDLDNLVYTWVDSVSGCVYTGSSGSSQQSVCPHPEPTTGIVTIPDTASTGCTTTITSNGVVTKTCNPPVDGVVSTTTYPEGRITIVYSSGAQDDSWSNGASRHTNPDGSYTQTDPDGSVHNFDSKGNEIIPNANIAPVVVVGVVETPSEGSTDTTCASLNYCNNAGSCVNGACECDSDAQGNDCSIRVLQCEDISDCDRCLSSGCHYCDDTTNFGCKAAAVCEHQACHPVSYNPPAAVEESSQSGLASPAIIAASVGGGIVALIILGALAFLVTSFLGTKKAVAYIRSLNDNSQAPLQDNPLFEPKNEESFNPLYQ